MLNYIKQKWRFLSVVLILFVFNIYVWDGACQKKEPQIILEKEPLVLR